MKEKNCYSSYPTKFDVDNHEQFLSRISKTLYYKKFPQKDGLSLPITELAAEIFTKVRNDRTLERLDVEEASRISRHACVSPCSFVLALLYLERLKDCNPEYLQKVAPSELFLVTLLVASKFLLDDGEEDEVYNSEWAQSGQISTAKINRLEMQFLKAINWSIYIHDKDFWEKLRKLEKHIAYKEACKRGWFSYTDLNSLINFEQLETILQTILGVYTVCIATYAAGLVTLLGSVLFASQIPGNLISLKQYTSISLLNQSSFPIQQNNIKIKLEEELEQVLLNSLTEESDEICNHTLIEDVINRNNLFVDSITSYTKIYINEWENKYNQNNGLITNSQAIISKDNNSNFLIHTLDFASKFSLPYWFDRRENYIRLPVNQKR